MAWYLPQERSYMFKAVQNAPGNASMGSRALLCREWWSSKAAAAKPTGKGGNADKPAKKAAAPVAAKAEAAPAKGKPTALKAKPRIAVAKKALRSQ